MITILHRGGGSLGTPKSDYVICARPLMGMFHKILTLGLTLWSSWMLQRKSPSKGVALVRRGENIAHLYRNGQNDIEYGVKTCLTQASIPVKVLDSESGMKILEGGAKSTEPSDDLSYLLVQTAIVLVSDRQRNAGRPILY